MSRGFIIGAGGESISIHAAVLHVSAPFGSTVSIAKGGVTVKSLGPGRAHTNTDGESADYYFSIAPANYGTWTVSATRENESDSASVIIDSNRQYDVEMSYTYWLYHHGNKMESVTGGYTAVAWRYTAQSWAAAAATVTENADSISVKFPQQANAVFRTVNAVDVTDFTVLKAVVDCTPLQTVNNNIIFALLNNTTGTYWADRIAAQLALQTQGWSSGVTGAAISLDISGVTGAKWIALGSNYGYEYTITFHDIWLE